MNNITPDVQASIIVPRGGLRANKAALTELISATFPGHVLGISYDDQAVTIDTRNISADQAEEMRRLVMQYEPPAPPPEIQPLQARLDALDALTAQKGELYHEDVKQALQGVVGVLRDLASKAGLI